MSKAERDARTKIPVEIDIALQALAKARNVDRAVIIREILVLWGETRLHEATVLHALLRAEGLTGADRGSP